MARVYVSSTFSDLQECREQVRLTLRRMDHNDMAMEYYTAEDTRPLDKCLEDVDACELYICLVAWRYGYVPQGFDQSITELEYRRAVQSGKPCLAFLLDENAKWPVNQVEHAAYDKVEEFRQELQQQHISSFFTGPDDIGARVAEAVYAWGKRQGIATVGGRTDWEAYRGAVFDKHRWVRLAVIAGAKQDRRFAQIPLTDVFVAQPTKLGRPTYDIVEDRLRDDKARSGELPEPPESQGVLQEPSLQALGRESKQVILGGPGSGKSTLFHFAMLTLCDPVPSEKTIPANLRHGPLPFLVELRQYTLRKSPGFVEYLVGHIREFYGVDVEVDDLRAVLGQQGRALVLFDGLDEILSPAERARVVDQFDAFARKYAGAGIVVSSRIAGYEPERLQLGGFTHYTLLDLGLTEIREFLPKWYRYYTWQGDERDAAGLLRRIADSPRLLNLGGNPLLLTMMAVIYKHQDLPEKRWQLYERCTQVLLEDWDVKRKNIERNELFPLDFHIVGEQKAEILQNVSMQMLSQQREGEEINAIRRGPLIGILADYLEQTYGKTRGDARATAADILNHLRERTYILAEIGEDTFGFVHRTFMEYFAACHAKAEFNSRRADYRWLTFEIFGAYWQRVEWQEILLLLIAMLKDQGSPIEEVVDHLLKLEVGGPPLNLAFAARCLGEAGTTDGAWAQKILVKLVRSILQWVGKTGQDNIGGFVDQALAAFSMLVPSLQPPESLRKMISDSAAKSRRHRMVAWQMELALRSSKERRTFAIMALMDPGEAVRLGAIAALEREWPGLEEVGVALLTVLRSDRVTRVRQAAVQALRRSWPEQPGILEAIAERVDDETAYSHVIWLIQYLSTSWQHDLEALEIVLQLAATKRRAGQNYSYEDVTRAAEQAIVDGWRDRPGTLERLQDLFRAENDRHVREAILTAMAEGWPSTDNLLGWLREQIRILELDSPFIVIDAVVTGWSGQPDALAWLQSLAAGENVGVRIAAIDGIANGWHGDPQVRRWLEQYAIDDPDPGVRKATLRMFAKHWKGPVTDELLRRQAVVEVDGDVRLHAILLAGYDDVHPGLRLFDFERDDRRWLFGRLRSDSLSLLEERALNDPASGVRQAALKVIYTSSPTALDFLCERLTEDRDPDVRATALTLVFDRVSPFKSTIDWLARGQWGRELELGNQHLREMTLFGVRYLQGESMSPSHLRADRDRVEQIRKSAEQDSEPAIRFAATLVFVVMAADDRSATLDWLRQRIGVEKDSTVRSLLEGLVEKSEQ